MKVMRGVVFGIMWFSLPGCKDEAAIAQLQNEIEIINEEVGARSSELEKKQATIAELEEQMAEMKVEHRKKLAEIEGSRDLAQADLRFVKEYLEVRKNEMDVILEKLKSTDPDFSEIGMLMFAIEGDKLRVGIQDVLKLREILGMDGSEEGDE